MTVLSIIIPNFNSGNLLEDSLYSIFQEKVSFDFEVLIMDNCSSDHPERIVGKFPFENLFFYSEPDEGIYDAMNKGIEKSKGNWLIFLGAGDLLSNDFEEVFLDLCKTNFLFVYGNSLYRKKNILYDGYFNLSKLLKKNICQQAIVYNRAIFQIFGKFNTNYVIVADYVLNLEIFFSLPTIKIKYIDRLLSIYREGGISENKRDVVFRSDKNKILLNLLFNYFSLFNLAHLSKYFFENLLIKIRNSI